LTATTDFIAKLVRAANKVEKTGESERKRLLDQSIKTILDMRQKVGIPPSTSAKDAVINLQRTSAAIQFGNASTEQIRTALLDAAGMIRDLHIVLDTDTQVAIDHG
jgi:hypothetical protein